MKWKDKAMEGLEVIANLSEDWDGEGSPKTDFDLVVVARSLLSGLKDDVTNNLPVPYVCPISGGSFQFEWHLPTKYLELEFTRRQKLEFGDCGMSILFLREEMVGKKPKTVCGELNVWDIHSVIQLLSWFVS